MPISILAPVCVARARSRRRRTTAIAPAQMGAIIAAIAAATTGPSHHANALSLIDATARATTAGVGTANGAKQSTDITASRLLTTGRPPSLHAASAQSYGRYGDLVDSTPCLGHAASTCMHSSDDALSDGNNNNSNRNGRPRRTNYFVVGTSHFRCDSANEVERIIREIGPDGVVIELDAERSERVSLCTVQDPGF